MHRNRIYLFFALVLGGIGLDQWTKVLAREHLPLWVEKPVLGKFFTLIHTKNDGAFLSLGSTFPDWLAYTIFIIMPIIALTALGIYTLRKRGETHLLVFIALSLIVSGGLGNLIDRIFFDRKVTDFMLMQVGGLHTGIFNVADVWITAALFMVVAAYLFQRKEKKAEPQEKGDVQP